MILLFTTQCMNGQVGKLLWEENFNSVDPDIWTYDVGDGCAEGICGWGNNELQYYRKENASIKAISGEPGNNALVITAKKETYGGKSFTSARLNSNNGISVKYGLIEIRALMPNLETGLWPALWMLGTSTEPWPAKGEIDIMEMGHNLAERTRQGHPDVPVNNYVGSNLIFYTDDACSDGNPTCAASTAYDVNYNKPYACSSSLVNKFITYRLYWTSKTVRFTLVNDGIEHDMYEGPFNIGEESLEFQKPFYFLMNLAVGGAFTDATTNDMVTAQLDAEMLVDYIKVYEYNGEGKVTTGSTAIKEHGVFGVFTDNTPVSNKLKLGVDANIYAWNNFSNGSIAPFEGDNAIAWKTSNATQWFGGGVMTNQARDMSNFVNGNLKFRIKVPADVNFKIGITDNYTNQYYVSFPANVSTYGLVRNGEWGQVSIPISDLTGGIIALQSMQYLFVISNDGALPSSTFEMAIDDIYWEGGGEGNGDEVGEEPETPINDGCTITASTNDFKTVITNSSENPSLTFVPIKEGMGDKTCILYYSTTQSGPFPGTYVSPGEPYQITCDGNKTVYFYYTYSLPTNGENTTLNHKNSFTVGNCGSLKLASRTDKEAPEPVSVYPIPSQDYISIKGLGEGEPITIVDITGRIVRKQVVPGNNKMDIQSLKNGVYFIKTEGDKTNNLKFIKR